MDEMKNMPSNAREYRTKYKGHRKYTRTYTSLLLLLLSVVYTVIANPFSNARADVDMVANDTLRTGWYANQPHLTPDIVGGGTFGKLFSAPINGQVFAQPLISHGIVLVTTEANNIYGLDAATGAQKWTRNVGNPFNPADVSCSDITKAVGVTGTPVLDPATNIAYFTAKSYVNGTTGAVVWYMHAVNVATGAEQQGFPARITGTASNDPQQTFNAKFQLQRPGLLLLNGVVYAAFGGHCDRRPYEGWIAGVSTAGKLTTLWSDEAGAAISDPAGPGAGIWMSGGGLVSDGAGQMIFASGNGEVPPTHTAGKNLPLPGELGQAVVRLAVQPNKTLKAVDFFSPYDADFLNTTDSDLGSGAPVELPAPYFGTKTYPHVLIEVGKQGYVFILNADNLGGRSEGPDGSDATINRVGPVGGLWSKPAVWPGNGGYVYMTTAQAGRGSGKLKVFKYGLDGEGKPTLTQVGTTTDGFGFGSSSPVITSTGTTTGSALVWVVWRPGNTAIGGELRAYNPIPVNGTLQMVYSAPLSSTNKFTQIAVDNNRVYLTTLDGHLLAFGAPVNTALSGSSLDLGTVVAGENVTKTLVLTATTPITIKSFTLNNTYFTAGTPVPALPAKLAARQTIHIPITFAPQTFGLEGGTLSLATSAGMVSFGVSGSGESATGRIIALPSPISFGGIAAGTTPAMVSTTLTNIGATPVRLTRFTLPKAPFRVTDLPALNSTLPSGSSVTVTIAFAPTVVGSYIDAFNIQTSAGLVKVPMSGNAGAAGHLTITPLKLNSGNVTIGKQISEEFTVSNTGGSPIAITRSKTPIKGVGFTALTNLPEGTEIQPGTTLKESILFAPKTPGTVTDTWELNSDDGSGVKIVTFTGKGIAP